MTLKSLLSISLVITTLSASLPALAETAIINWKEQDAIVPNTTNPTIPKGESVPSQPTEYTNSQQPKYQKDCQHPEYTTNMIMYSCVKNRPRAKVRN
jgi:hypothetical protein